MEPKSTPHPSPNDVRAHDRAQLAKDWRHRATRLDDYARQLRRDGDTVLASDAEQAATDYRVAADELEVCDV